MILVICSIVAVLAKDSNCLRSPNLDFPKMAQQIVGKAAPDMALEISSGTGETKECSLLSLQQPGQAMVLDFFAPWCKACPKAAQHLDHLAESYAERCQFVLICVDGDVDEALSFAKEHGITRCIAASVVDENAPASYHVSGLPHHTLIAPDGTIARNYEVNLPGDLDEALAKEASNDFLAPVPKKSPISDKYKELEKQDPLLKENPRRWVMFPLQYPEVWEMYKKHEASFWTAEEIDLAQDNKDWVNLTESEQHFVKHLGLSLRLKLGSWILLFNCILIIIYCILYISNNIK